MATININILNHFYDQTSGSAPNAANGIYYVRYDNNQFNAAWYGGQPYIAYTDNGTADHWVVDLTALDNYDASILSVERMFFLGDSRYNKNGYNGDPNDPSTFDSWTFILPTGWTMTESTTYGLDNDDGTYFVLKDELGNIILNDTNVAYSMWVAGEADFVNIICFTNGTRLLCADGEWRAVDDIEEGDLVMTKDAGLQPVKWAGHTRVSRETLQQFPNRRPIVFEPGAIGNTERLRVSPQHRMLVTGAMDGGPAEERLVPAKHLVNDHNIYVDNSCEPVRYYHIMMDEHQIVKSEGAWSESFWPGAYIRDAMDPMAWSQVEFYFPELATSNNPEEAYGKPAREFLKRKHVEVFLNQEAAR